ncbi:unnamed protein product [Somion occarium]|uniref:Uncharacterized protein n=1 Tax=Somion occarium TaxID=3059160 RepID=A0ABP1DY33_9APHY
MPRSVRRYGDLVTADGKPITDNLRVFKKEFQVVDKPAVTDHNIHDDYIRDPPHNQGTLSIEAIEQEHEEEQRLAHLAQKGRKGKRRMSV